MTYSHGTSINLYNTISHLHVKPLYHKWIFHISILIKNISTFKDFKYWYTQFISITTCSIFLFFRYVGWEIDIKIWIWLFISEIIYQRKDLLLLNRSYTRHILRSTYISHYCPHMVCVKHKHIHLSQDILWGFRLSSFRL